LNSCHAINDASVAKLKEAKCIYGKTSDAATPAKCF